MPGLRGLRPRGCGLALEVLRASYAAHLVVAGTAVDRTVTARDEGHFRHDTAVRAGGRVHLAGRLAAEAGEHAVLYVALFGLGNTSSATGCTAARTAGRLVLEALLGVEFLLAGSEHERAAAVLAVNFFVIDMPTG